MGPALMNNPSQTSTSKWSLVTMRGISGDIPGGKAWARAKMGKTRVMMVRCKIVEHLEHVVCPSFQLKSLSAQGFQRLTITYHAHQNHFDRLPLQYWKLEIWKRPLSTWFAVSDSSNSSILFTFSNTPHPPSHRYSCWNYDLCFTRVASVLLTYCAQFLSRICLKREF